MKNSKPANKNKISDRNKERDESKNYHHGDLKKSLIEAVLELVGEKGPRGFSMNEASRRAGVSVAAPYKHFADKEALIAEVIQIGNELLESELRAACQNGRAPQDQMLEVCLAYLRFAKNHAAYFSLMFGSEIDKSKYPALRKSAIKAFGVLDELAQEASSDETQARERAVTFWALVHGLATLSAEGALTHASGTAFDETLFRKILSRAIRREFE